MEHAAWTKTQMGTHQTTASQTTVFFCLFVFLAYLLYQILCGFGNEMHNEQIETTKKWEKYQWENKGKERAYENGIGFANGPKIDLVILSTGDKHSRRLPANLEAVDSGTMRYKFLWRHTLVKANRYTDQPKCTAFS